MKRTIIIIGRGIAGLTLAYELLCLEQDLDVVVIGPDNDPQAATPAAMGVSVTKGKCEPRQPLFAAKLAGHAHLKDYLPRIERQTGVRIRRLMGAVFEPFDGEEQYAKIRGRVFKDRSDDEVRRLGYQGLDRLVQTSAAPLLAHMPATGAFTYPGDLWFDPKDLLAALDAGIRQKGGRVIDGMLESMSAIEVNEAGQWRLLVGGAPHLGTDVVLAMGAGAGLLLQGLQLDHLVLEPVVGVTLEVNSHSQSTGEAGGGRGVVVLDGRMNFVSYENRLLFGSTSDRGTLAPPDAFSRLTDRLRFFVPDVGTPDSFFRIPTSRSGVRARFSDRLPVIGPVVSPLFRTHIWVSLGYYKNGLQLAPLFCRDLAQWIVFGAAPPALFPFSSSRPSLF